MVFFSTALNTIKSSANIKCTILLFLHWGWNLKPDLVLAFSNNWDKHSIIKTNSRGNNGSPCLSPLPPSNLSKVAPFMCILKVGVDIQAMIQVMNVGGKFKLVSIFSTHSQYTESYAFLKSIFIMHLADMFFLVYPLTISWQRSTLNNSSLPATKAP